ncbi:hypothetical protein BsWGS_23860 [Bradybaena similaris]
MECRILGIVFMSLRCILMVTNSQAYTAAYDNLEDNIIEPSNGQPPIDVGSRAEGDRVSGISLSSDNHAGESEGVNESLGHLTRSLVHPVDQLPMTINVAPSVLREVLRHALLMKSPKDTRVDTLNTLRSLFGHFGKRSWSRLSVQTRFAPFGTKLVPNRKLENGGATLLRYGRDAQNH